MRFVSLADLAESLAGELARENHAGVDRGALSTGLAALDAHIGGLRAGEVLLLAGPPGVGKTALLLHFVAACTVHQDLPALLISLQATCDQALRRLAAGIAEVSYQGLANGTLTDAEWVRVVELIERLTEAPLWISTEHSRSMGTLLESVRRIQLRLPRPALVAIDSLTLLADVQPGSQAQGAERLESASRDLKWLARSIDAPVVATLTWPQAEDLAATASEADVVLFLKPKVWVGKAPSDARPVELVVVRQRLGTTATVPLVLRASRSSVRER
jgi:replicative DNA helicase